MVSLTIYAATTILISFNIVVKRILLDDLTYVCYQNQLMCGGLVARVPPFLLY